jgi:hypothetical protein
LAFDEKQAAQWRGRRVHPSKILPAHDERAYTIAPTPPVARRTPDRSKKTNVHGSRASLKYGPKSLEGALDGV